MNCEPTKAGTKLIAIQAKREIMLAEVFIPGDLAIETARAGFLNGGLRLPDDTGVALVAEDHNLPSVNNQKRK